MVVVVVVACVTFGHAVPDPIFTLLHTLHRLVRTHKEAIPLHPEVEGSLQVPQDGDLLLQRFHLRHSGGHDVLVVVGHER